MFLALLSSLAALASIQLPAPPAVVRFDGQVVATLVHGNGTSRCARIVVWRLGGRPRTIDTGEECDTDDGSVIGLALAGTTVAWLEETYSNDPGRSLVRLTIRKASVDRPVPRLVEQTTTTRDSNGDSVGAFSGDLAGHGGLMVYATWRLCDPDGDGGRECSPGLPDIYDETLLRIGGGVLRQGPDAIDPVWVDSGRVLIRYARGRLLLLDGPAARRLPLVPGLVSAAVQGRQLVTLTPTALAVYDPGTMARVRSQPLAPGSRTLQDVDGGIAVLGHGTDTHLVRVADGKGTTYRNARHAQLEPAGLVYASGKRLLFVPRAAVLGRFG